MLEGNPNDQACDSGTYIVEENGKTCTDSLIGAKTQIKRQVFAATGSSSEAIQDLAPRMPRPGDVLNSAAPATPVELIAVSSAAFATDSDKMKGMHLLPNTYYHQLTELRDTNRRDCLLRNVDHLLCDHACNVWSKYAGQIRNCKR